MLWRRPVWRLYMHRKGFAAFRFLPDSNIFKSFAALSPSAPEACAGGLNPNKRVKLPFAAPYLCIINVEGVPRSPDVWQKNPLI